MAIGGVRNTGSSGGNPQQGNATSGGQGSGKEFALEKQQTAMGDNAKANAAAAGTALVKTKDSKTSKIVDRKKRNRRGAPRTVLVDGEIYEVFLLAIA